MKNLFLLSDIIALLQFGYGQLMNNRFTNLHSGRYHSVMDLLHHFLYITLFIWYSLSWKGGGEECSLVLLSC